MPQLIIKLQRSSNVKISGLSLTTNLRDTEGNLHLATSFSSRWINGSMVDHCAVQLHDLALKDCSSVFFFFSSPLNCLFNYHNLSLENFVFQPAQQGLRVACFNSVCAVRIVLLLSPIGRLSTCFFSQLLRFGKKKDLWEFLFS